MNVVQTLKNLKEAFPKFQLDTLLKIVECVVEEEAPPVQKQGIVFKPSKRQHLADKTSSGQRILTDGYDYVDDED